MKMFFRESSPKRSVLYSVLYVLKLACNLFSVRAAAAKGNTVNFGYSKYWIRDREGKVRGMGSLVDKLYRLDSQPLTLEYTLLWPWKREVIQTCGTNVLVMQIDSNLKPSLRMS